MHAALALCALMVEAVCGYPQWLFRTAGHPVSWIGALIVAYDRRWNVACWSFAGRRTSGAAALLMCLVVAGAGSLAVVALSDHFLPALLALVVQAIAASTLIAQRSLYTHVAAVADALEGGTILQARLAVSKIVGRDANSLGVHAIARAAIESLAENFSDGVVAPVFWLVLGGLPGAALYKTINTADSMIGHKSERYHAFGWAAARLDDLVNLPASRLSALLFSGAATLQADASGRDALRATIRDAAHHRSPNAGWPEAAMAGALGLSLAGPRVYGGTSVNDHWMGGGRKDAIAGDIRRALHLYRTACVLQAGLVAAIAAVVLLASGI